MTFWNGNIVVICDSSLDIPTNYFCLSETQLQFFHQTNLLTYMYEQPMVCCADTAFYCDCCPVFDVDLFIFMVAETPTSAIRRPKALFTGWRRNRCVMTFCPGLLWTKKRFSTEKIMTDGIKRTFSPQERHIHRCMNNIENIYLWIMRLIGKARDFDSRK